MRAAVVLAASCLASSASALELTTQGRVTDSSGDPVVQTADLTVRLWRDENSTASADLLFTELFSSYDFQGGLYAVTIGSDVGNPVNDAWFAQDVWLGITVGTGAELQRQRIASVPRAGVASRVVDGSIHVGANTAATCPGDTGALRWANDTLEACTSSGWVDALAPGYDDAAAIAAVSATDAYLLDTTDTFAGTLSVTGAVQVEGDLTVNNGTIQGPLIIGANPGATCPGDTGALRYTGGTLEVCTASGWTDALAPAYSDAQAVSAVAATDAYLKDTTDTLSGNLTVTGTTSSNTLGVTGAASAGSLSVSGTSALGAVTFTSLNRGYGRNVHPTLYPISRSGGTTVYFTAPDGVQYSLDIPNASVDAGFNNPAGRIAYQAATGRLFFNLSGSPTYACTLLHEEDDGITGPHRVATDAGNGMIGVWGVDNIRTLVLDRVDLNATPPGAQANVIPMNINQAFVLACF